MNNAESTEELTGATKGYGLALAVASVASAILVIAKERGPASVMAAMKAVTGHHWKTHSLFAVAIFLVGGFALSRVNGGRGVKVAAGTVLKTLVAGVVLGAVMIGGCYLSGD